MKKRILILRVLIFSIAMGSLINKAIATNFSNLQTLPSLAPMLEQVMPSVVSINVEGSTTVNTPRMPPQFQQFFGDDSPFCRNGSPFQGSPLCQIGPDGSPLQNIQQNFQVLGAGVVIDALHGYVVTNNHVVDNANKIQVKLSDSRRYDAKVIGKDMRSDIALLQLKEFKNLIAIKIADSDKLRVGDFAIAIGNPYGLGETATSGIVSALGRSGLNIENYENFIQTDAAINRGNSGGALLNLNGELIGINTAILAPDGGNIGIGFAIPSNMVKNLTAQMIAYGQVQRGELGIKGIELNFELAKAMKIDVQRGVFVSEVMPKSSASKAGIKAGDVITIMNDKTISSFASFRAEIGTLPIGSKMKLGIIRESKLIILEAILEQSTQTKIESGKIYNGLEGAELSNTQIGVQHGVKVDRVKDSSAAARAGLKKDDIILGLNQEPIKNINELRKILETSPPVLVLNIQRGENRLYLLIQ